MTYEEVVKNPNFLKDLEKVEGNNKNVIELNQFKVKKEEKEKEFKKTESIKTEPSKMS